MMKTIDPVSEEATPTVGSNFIRLPTGILILVLAIGTVCLGNGARRIGTPFPGFLVSENRIVLSIGLQRWPIEKSDRILFATVVAVDGKPVADGSDIGRYIADLPVGTSVSYRFRKQATVFRDRIDVQRFRLKDFLAVYVTYFLTGLGYAWLGWYIQRRYPQVFGAAAFFLLCETVALVLLTGGDVYGPYWFTWIYFTAHCLVGATILHFASTYPAPLGLGSGWRSVALAAVYGLAFATAVALNLVADDSSLFLPLIYTVYLLIANALLLYLGRLALVVWTSTDERVIRSVRYALTGFLLSATAPGIIFIIYPAINEPISPVSLVAPLIIFPVFTLLALRSNPVEPQRAGPSVRERLSLLFLGAVETAFLVGIGVFWLNNTWTQLVDGMALNHQQQTVAEQFLVRPSSVPQRDLQTIDSFVQTVPERRLVREAIAAVDHNDLATARAAIDELLSRYRTTAAALDVWRQRLRGMDPLIVAGLVVLGIAQAVAFMLAIRRWLIQPIDQLTAATGVIATGDLSHRVRLNGSDEFRSLAGSINSMAASLAQIQARMEAAQQARHRAAGAARDAERQRLARELHDSVLQDLGAVKLHLEGVAREAHPNLSPVIASIIDIVVGLRRVVDDLGASDLSQVSLRDAIVSYARALAAGHEVPIDIDLAATAEVPDWATRDVYRIVQEALTNAVRHGAPAHLWVRLYRADDQTKLEIADDGTGFDPQGAAMGTGLRAMRDRAAAIGATITVTSTPGHGTRVGLALPLHPSNDQPRRSA